jgi:hypothetical protein
MVKVKITLKCSQLSGNCQAYLLDISKNNDPSKPEISQQILDYALKEDRPRRGVNLTLVATGFTIRICQTFSITDFDGHLPLGSGL